MSTPFYLSSTFTFLPVQVQADPPTQSVSALVTSSIEEDRIIASAADTPSCIGLDFL